MAKLSTIEDVEQRAQQPQPVEATPAPAPASKPTLEEKLAADVDMTAEQEEAFHGLDSQQPMGLGHKSLIVVAAVVLVAAILYIVNSWIHFV